MHSLPREQEEIVNNMLREFKLNCVMMNGDGQVKKKKSISFNFEEDVLVIPLVDNNERHNPEVARQQAAEREAKKHSKEYKKKKKYERFKNPTRAMKKRELQQMIEEEEEEWER